MPGTRPTRALAVAMLAVSSAGCMAGEYTLWRGKTADRRHRVEVVELAGRQSVRIDDHEGVAFEAVAPGSLTFSSDGRHVAYAARQQGAWHVVRDGRVGPAWDAVSEVVLSPVGDGLVYGAERAGRRFVVRGERPTPAFDGLLSGTLRFSEDGSHLAYVAADAGTSKVVIDETVGPAVDGVGELQISRDGAHVAYAARLSGRGFVVFDGATSGPWDAVAELVLGQRGRLAYIARSRGALWVASSRLDAAGLVESGPYQAASGLALSTDEQDVAWVSRLGEQDVVVIDGQPAAERYASIVATSLVFRPKQREVAFVAGDGGGRFRVRIGDTLGAPFEEIEGAAISFSADGRRAGYTGRRGSQFVVVLDGVEQPSESWAGRPVFDAQGTRSAYVARRQDRSSVIVDGKSHEFDVAIEGTLAFSKDGRHWSCLVGSALDHSFHFVVDGRRRSQLDFEELISAAQALSIGDVARGRADDILRSWAAAEAELASSPPPPSAAR
jgi:hypothetical protein